MNRSEELSRLLGIEPKSQCELSPVDECCELECPCVECELDKPNIYPDFTKPDNFVKLLENIKIDGNELCDWLICYSGSFCNRQDFIYRLIELVKEYTGVIGGLTQDIKTIRHQAQQTDWTY